MSARALPRAVAITVSSLLLAPFRAANRTRYLRIAEPEPLERSPLFVVGPWGSGVGDVHRLLCRTGDLVGPSLWQVFNPVSFDRLEWSKLLFRPLVSRHGGPYGDGTAGWTEPASDEVAMAALTPHSYFHCLYFPATFDRQFRSAVLMDDLEEADRALWRDAFVAFLRAVERSANGAGLVLGNPAHTARIPLLLELFPDARFLFVHRNPYELYPVALRQRRRRHRALGLQTVPGAELDRQVTSQYRALVRRFLHDRTRIPSDRLVEIRYEDLDTDPDGLLRWIRAELDLDRHRSSSPETISSGPPARDGETCLDRRPTREEIRHVDREWAFAFEAFGYRRPG